LTGSRDDADDALQEAFFRLWRHRHDITSREQAEKMLSVAVRNAGIDTLRERARMQPTTETAEPAAREDEERANRADTLAQVTRLIESGLTEQQRKVLYLRDRDGWEIADIAARYGLTESHVRIILSRARRTVRELYRKQQL
ncbi:MAG: sigma-70 family RNA polymerase sigma factor, partial [Muribaculaceae bacterium]|nr:sigma-70 family RNA polymerase sigma factor [Muribaculaceae bacterium]